MPPENNTDEINPLDAQEEAKADEILRALEAKKEPQGEINILTDELYQVLLDLSHKSGSEIKKVEDVDALMELLEGEKGADYVNQFDIAKVAPQFFARYEKETQEAKQREEQIDHYYKLLGVERTGDIEADAKKALENLQALFAKKKDRDEKRIPPEKQELFELFKKITHEVYTKKNKEPRKHEKQLEEIERLLGKEPSQELPIEFPTTPESDQQEPVSPFEGQRATGRSKQRLAELNRLKDWKGEQAEWDRVKKTSKGTLPEKKTVIAAPKPEEGPQEAEEPVGENIEEDKDIVRLQEKKEIFMTTVRSLERRLQMGERAFKSLKEYHNADVQREKALLAADKVQGEIDELRKQKKTQAEKEAPEVPPVEVLRDNLAKALREKSETEQQEFLAKLAGRKVYQFNKAGEKQYLRLKDTAISKGQKDLTFEVYDLEGRLVGQKKWPIERILYREWKKGEPSQEEVEQSEKNDETVAFRDDKGEVSNRTVGRYPFVGEKGKEIRYIFKNEETGEFQDGLLDAGQVVKYEKDGKVMFAKRTEPRPGVKTEQAKQPEAKREKASKAILGRHEKFEDLFIEIEEKKEALTQAGINPELLTQEIAGFRRRVDIAPVIDTAFFDQLKGSLEQFESTYGRSIRNTVADLLNRSMRARVEATREKEQIADTQALREQEQLRENRKELQKLSRKLQKEQTGETMRNIRGEVLVGEEGQLSETEHAIERNIDNFGSEALAIFDTFNNWAQEQWGFKHITSFIDKHPAVGTALAATAAIGIPTAGAITGFLGLGLPVFIGVPLLSAGTLVSGYMALRGLRKYDQKYGKEPEEETQPPETTPVVPPPSSPPPAAETRRPKVTIESQQIPNGPTITVPEKTDAKVSPPPPAPEKSAGATSAASEPTPEDIDTLQRLAGLTDEQIKPRSEGDLSPEASVKAQELLKDIFEYEWSTGNDVELEGKRLLEMKNFEEFKALSPETIGKFLRDIEQVSSQKKEKGDEREAAQLRRIKKFRAIVERGQVPVSQKEKPWNDEKTEKFKSLIPAINEIFANEDQDREVKRNAENMPIDRVKDQLFSIYKRLRKKGKGLTAVARERLNKVREILNEISTRQEIERNLEKIEEEKRQRKEKKSKKEDKK